MLEKEIEHRLARRLLLNMEKAGVNTPNGLRLAQSNMAGHDDCRWQTTLLQDRHPYRRLRSSQRPPRLRRRSQLMQGHHAHEDQRTSLMAQTDSYRKKILEHPGWKFMRWPCRTYRFGADKVDIKVCDQYREYSDRSPQSEGTGVGVYFEEQNKCALDKKGGTSPRMCPGHAQAFCRRQGVYALRSGGGTLAIIAENGTLFYK